MTAETLPLKKRIRRKLRKPYFFISRWLFDPIGLTMSIVNTARGFPIYVRNLTRYSSMNQRRSFSFSMPDAWFRSFDRFANAGSLQFHYFFQDLWAAQWLRDAGVTKHVDVGSRVDGFIAHILPFCEVTYVDVRPLGLDWPGFHFKQGLITQMPFEDESVHSLSTLHVIEHIGLGRYGDPVDPEGSWKAARELARVLAPGGTLLLGVPTGEERVCFDAHRIFAPETTVAMFEGLELVEFSFINDRNELTRNATFDEARKADYGCGLFVFRKPARKA